MLSILNASSLVSNATNGNARFRDIIKLITGEITTTAGLDSTQWTVSSCLINNTVPANWSRIYCSTDFDTLGSTTPITTYVNKSAAFGKYVSAKFLITAGSLAINTGTFLADGSATLPSTAVTFGTIAPSQNIIVATGPSGFLLYTGGLIYFLVERSTYPYDKNSTENLGVLGYTSGSTANAYFSGLFNPSTKNYTFTAPTAFVGTTGSVGLSRDANSNPVTPIIPFYVESYENGWLGGDLSANMGLYRIADNVGNHLDTLTSDGKTYRILSGTSGYRYAVVDA